MLHHMISTSTYLLSVWLIGFCWILNSQQAYMNRCTTNTIIVSFVPHSRRTQWWFDYTLLWELHSSQRRLAQSSGWYNTMSSVCTPYLCRNIRRWIPFGFDCASRSSEPRLLCILVLFSNKPFTPIFPPVGGKQLATVAQLLEKENMEQNGRYISIN